jgi:hypothetical protein
VEEGREFLRARAAELELSADVARDTAGQAAKRRKLDKELENTDKNNPPQTKEDWKKWIDDVLSQYDKQLGQLDRQYQTLSKRAEALKQSYTQASDLLIAARTNRIVAAKEHFGPVGFAYWSEQMVSYNEQMISYETQFNVVVNQMNDVAQAASTLADRRAAAIARYEEETGDKIPKNPEMDKWATRIIEKRPKLTAKASSAKTQKKDPAAKKRLPTFRTLLPLDFERERNELLASFGLRPVAPPELVPPPEGDAPGGAQEPKVDGKSDR